jgi:hypothetical protein
VATRIRAAQSDLVLKVNYRPEDFIDPAVVDVYLRPGTTKAQALEVWCGVVLPAGGEDLEGGGKAVSLWDAGGNTFMTPEADCPAPSPS